MAPPPRKPVVFRSYQPIERNDRAFKEYGNNDPIILATCPECGLRWAIPLRNLEPGVCPVCLLGEGPHGP